MVLSSGFLAFALHTGFLKAVEEVSAQHRDSVCELMPAYLLDQFHSLHSIAVEVNCSMFRHAVLEASPAPLTWFRMLLVGLSSGELALMMEGWCVQAKIEVSGIMGTSAGALSGSLFAAGMSADEVRLLDLLEDAHQECVVLLVRYPPMSENLLG